MNILIVPDSFKGSLSSKEVCKSIKSGIESVENHNITCLPFADGGEGFGECLSSFCSKKPEVVVKKLMCVKRL